MRYGAGARDGESIQIKGLCMSEWEVNVPIEKINETEHLVFGWASIIEKDDGSALVDLQGDRISEEELEKAAYEFVQFYREGGDRHQVVKGVATLVESFVITKHKREILKVDNLPLGWWVGFKVHDESVFKQIQTGELSMFSIGGDAMRVPDNA